MAYFVKSFDPETKVKTFCKTGPNHTNLALGTSNPTESRDEAPYWIQRVLLLEGLYPKQWTCSLLSPAGSQKTGNPLSIPQESEDAWRQLTPSRKNTHRYRHLNVIQSKIFKKSLLNVLLYCFCFTFWFFGHKAGRILAPRIPPPPDIKPTPPASEGSLNYWTAREAPDSKLLVWIPSQ